MSKRVKVFISTLVVVALLAVGSTVTVVAQEEPEEVTPPVLQAEAVCLLTRVAEILEIDEEALVNAFKQARQEMCEESFINRVNEAVAEELITQEQADAIIEWWQQRPGEALREWQGQKPKFMEPGMFQNTLRFRAMPRFHMRNGLGGLFCPESSE